MTTVLELGLTDLAGTRFAVSPLSETARAVLLLGRPTRATVNQPWLDWARARLEQTPLTMPLTWPLLINGLDFYPEFLAPAVPGPRPSIEQELARVRATPVEAVRASLRRVFGDASWPGAATALDQDPPAALATITTELHSFYQQLISPHWERIQAVLEADIGYRTRQLATEELIGVTRARLLDTLRSPAGTSTLARQLGVTPGAVSQHLGALYRGGLLTRQRSGRTVLYQASDLGLALLGAPQRLGHR